MEKKTLHAIVEGRVQGVSFRGFTCQEAVNLGLTGWVRNRPDGSVEALFSGEDEAVNRMVTWLHRGSPMSKVDHVHIEEQDVEESFATFDVRY